MRFADLMTEVNQEAEEKGLPFVAKDGKTVLLRPVMLLSEMEMKTVLGLLPKLNNDDVSVEEKLSYAGTILVAAADRKDSLKRSLAELPPIKHLKIVEAWMAKAGSEVPES